MPRHALVPKLATSAPRPLLDRRSKPDAAQRENCFRLREVIVRSSDRVDPLPAHTKHLGDLCGTHQVARSHGARP